MAQHFSPSCTAALAAPDSVLWFLKPQTGWLLLQLCSAPPGLGLFSGEKLFMNMGLTQPCCLPSRIESPTCFWSLFSAFRLSFSFFPGFIIVTCRWVSPYEPLCHYWNQNGQLFFFPTIYYKNVQTFRKIECLCTPVTWYLGSKILGCHCF